MPGGGGTSTTVQSNNPPAWAAPGLKTVAKDAKGIYTGTNPFTPNPASSVVPLDPLTRQSLSQQTSIANQSQPLIGATQQGILGNLQNNGINPTANAGIAGLQGYANGSYVNGGSPEFQKALDFQSQQTADDVQRQFSGMGRLGSGADTNALTQQIGGLRNNAMSQEIAREQGLQQSAAGQLIQAGQGGNANMLQAAALAPTADQFQYAPSERLAQVGAANEQQAGLTLQDQMNKYTANQQAPLQNLQAYSDFLQGVSRPYGTSTTTSPLQNTSIAGGILGGALGGGQIGSSFGPVGTGIGAIGGGLLGGLFR